MGLILQTELPPPADKRVFFNNNITLTDVSGSKRYLVSTTQVANSAAPEYQSLTLLAQNYNLTWKLNLKTSDAPVAGGAIEAYGVNAADCSALYLSSANTSYTALQTASAKYRVSLTVDCISTYTGSAPIKVYGYFSGGSLIITGNMTGSTTINAKNTYSSNQNMEAVAFYGTGIAFNKVSGNTKVTAYENKDSQPSNYGKNMAGAFYSEGTMTIVALEGTVSVNSTMGDSPLSENTDNITFGLCSTGTMSVGKITKNISVKSDARGDHQTAGFYAGSEMNIVNIQGNIDVKGSSDYGAAYVSGFDGKGGIDFDNISSKSIKVSAEAEKTAFAEAVTSTSNISVSGTVSSAITVGSNATGNDATAAAVGFNAGGELYFSDKVSSAINVSATAQGQATAAVFFAGSNITFDDLTGTVDVKAISNNSDGYAVGFSSANNISLNDFISKKISVSATGEKSAYAADVNASYGSINVNEDFSANMTVTATSTEGTAFAYGYYSNTGFSAHRDFGGSITAKSSAAYSASGDASIASAIFTNAGNLTIANDFQTALSVSAENKNGEAESYGIVTFSGGISIDGDITGAITLSGYAESEGNNQASTYVAGFMTDWIDIGDISKNITVSGSNGANGSGDAVAFQAIGDTSQSGSVMDIGDIRANIAVSSSGLGVQSARVFDGYNGNVELGDIAGAVSSKATSSGDDAYAAVLDVYSINDYGTEYQAEIGKITGNVTAEATVKSKITVHDASAYGIIASGNSAYDFDIEAINANINATATAAGGGADAFALYNAAGDISTGEITKKITAKANGVNNQTNAVAVMAYGYVTFDDINGSISATANSTKATASAFGIGAADVEVDKITNSITANATADRSAIASAVLTYYGNINAAQVSGAISATAKSTNDTAKASALEASGNVVIDSDITSAISATAEGKGDGSAVTAKAVSGNIISVGGYSKGAIKASATSNYGQAGAEAVAFYAESSTRFTEDLISSVTATAKAKGGKAMAYGFQSNLLLNHDFLSNLTVSATSDSGSAYAYGVAGTVFTGKITNSGMSYAKSTFAGKFTITATTTTGSYSEAYGIKGSGLGLMMEKFSGTYNVKSKGGAGTVVRAYGVYDPNSICITNSIGTWSVTANGGASKGSEAIGWSVSSLSAYSGTDGITGTVNVKTLADASGTASSAVGIHISGTQSNEEVLNINVSVTAKNGTAYGYKYTGTSAEGGRLVIGKSTVSVKGNSSSKAILGGDGNQTVELLSGAKITGDIDLEGTGKDKDQLIMHSGSSVKGNLADVEDVIMVLDDADMTGALWEAVNCSGINNLDLWVDEGITGTFTLFKGQGSGFDVSYFGSADGRENLFDGVDLCDNFGNRLTDEYSNAVKLSLGSSVEVNGFEYKLSCTDGKTVKLDIGIAL